MGPPRKKREKHEGFPGERHVVRSQADRFWWQSSNRCSEHCCRPMRDFILEPAGISVRGRRAVRKRFSFTAPAAAWLQCEIGGRRHEVSEDQLLVIPRIGRPMLMARRGGTLDDSLVSRHRRRYVPYYLEKLGVTEQKPVVRLGGDVQLFSLFREMCSRSARTWLHFDASDLRGAFADSFDGRYSAAQG